MTVTMRFNVRKDLSVKELQIRRPSPMTKVDSAGYHITTAHGPELMENAKNSVRYMIEWLVANYGLSESQAYCICSTARRSQDQRNRGCAQLDRVHAHAT